MEAAQAGSAVRGSGDDGHEGIIGGILVARHVLCGVGGPIHKEALRVVVKRGKLQTHHGEFPALHRGEKLLLRHANGVYLHLQHAGKLAGDLLCHKAVGPLLQIEVLQLSQVRAALIAGILENLHGLGAILGIKLGGVIHQRSGAGAEVLRLAVRHTVGDQSSGSLAAGKGGSGVAVNGLHRGLAQGPVLEGEGGAVEDQGIGGKGGNGVGLRELHRPHRVHFPLFIERNALLGAVRKAEGNAIRAGGLAVVIMVVISHQAQVLGAFALRDVGAADHQGLHILPPGRTVTGHLHSLLHSMGLGGDDAPAHRHGGRVGTNILQEPGMVAGEVHHQGGIVLGGDLEKGHIAGLTHRFISAHHAHQLCVGRVVHRAGQALPGIDHVIGGDGLAVRPLGAAQAEGVGHRTVHIGLLLYVLGKAVDGGGIPLGIHTELHQVFIEVGDDAALHGRLGVDGVQGLIAVSQGNGEGEPLLGLAAAGKAGDCQGQAQRPKAFCKLHKHHSITARLPSASNLTGTIWLRVLEAISSMRILAG